jgi:hypothetical protein
MKMSYFDLDKDDIDAIKSLVQLKLMPHDYAHVKAITLEVDINNTHASSMHQNIKYTLKEPVRLKFDFEADHRGCP